MYIFLYIIIFLVLFLNGNDYFYFTVQKEKYDSFLFFFLVIRSDLSTVGKELLSCLFLRNFETGILQEECCFIAVGKVDI